MKNLTQNKLTNIQGAFGGEVRKCLKRERTEERKQNKKTFNLQKLKGKR